MKQPKKAIYLLFGLILWWISAINVQLLFPETVFAEQEVEDVEDARQGEELAAVSSTVVHELSFGSVTPTSAVQGQENLQISITGEGFSEGIKVEFSAPQGCSTTGIHVKSIEFKDSTNVLVFIDVHNEVPAGTCNISLINPDDNTSIGEDVFTINPRPIISQIEPVCYAQGASGPITIAGTNLLKETQVSFSNEGIKITSPQGCSTSELNDAEGTILIQIQIDEQIPPGKYDITVINPDGGTYTGEGVFTVTPKPLIEKIEPVCYVQGTKKQPLTITGKEFLKETQVSFSRRGITINSTRYKNKTTILLNISIDDKAPAGKRNITVNNPDGGIAVGKGIFTINPKPSISKIEPAVYVQGTSGPITITGSNFLKEIIVSFSNDGIKVTSPQGCSTLELNDIKNISIQIQIDEQIPPGKYNITITNPDGGTYTRKSALTITPKPLIEKIDTVCYAQGAKKQPLTITGKVFLKETRVSFSGKGITIDSVECKDKTTILLNISIDDRATAGKRDIIITNPDGGTEVGTDIFTVNSKPIIITVSPSGCTPGREDQVVSIFGTGFTPDSRVGFSSEKIGINSVIFINSTNLVVNVSVNINAESEYCDIMIVNPDKGVVIGKGLFGIDFLDKRLVYYGNLNGYKKPACVKMADILKTHPAFKSLSKKERSGNVAKYWLMLGEVNRRLAQIYKMIQARYGYDLVGEQGFIKDVHGNQIILPDITKTVIKQLKKE